MTDIRFRMSKTYLALILAFLMLAKAEDSPILWDDPSLENFIPATRSTESVYRLPEGVIPLEYDIYIDLYFDERTDRPFSYDGSVNIVIQAVQANITEIVLHANVDRIRSISLLTQNGSPVPLKPSNPFHTEPEYHFLKVNLGTILTLGNNYTLYIEYSSTMNDGPMKRGIWKGWYVDDNGVERIYATTHFQPYNARQAFPCWDEPLYKAVFTLHLSRPLNYSSNFANTRIQRSENVGVDRELDHFYPSPVMSSYLVTFLISETFTVIAEDTSFHPPVRIIARSNAAGLGAPALDLATGMTKYFDQYFDIPYSSMSNYLNNDHVASPDWASAGTENWGMVSYRELYLILDNIDTIMSVEHYAATLVSHELAHKWFGNLITCYWWSNTWINEGYASYFGYMATHQMFPKYELHEHFNSRYLQTSLSFDSGSGTMPMNHEVNTPAQVTGHFGTISYSKAASFLRMTANMITPETFQKSCRLFLKNNSFRATNQSDLLAAFVTAVQEDGSLNEYANFNFTEYYDVWVNQPGYPLLTVNVDHSSGEMRLSQERFFLSSTASSTGQIYPIPITFSTQRSRNFENLKPVYMMTTERAVIQKIPGEEWIIFNHQQQAHYRVTYDDRTWSLIAQALMDEPDTIHHLNRAQVVDDVFALMRSRKMTFNTGFGILRFLRRETNYHVWNPAISGFTWLRNRLRHTSSSAEFDSIILGYLEHVIETLGFDPSINESTTVSLTRQEVMQFACNLGHKKCIEDSLQKFIRMRDNGALIDRRIRRQVYMNGIREGGQQDFVFLMGRFHQSNMANDQLEMLRGLGAAKDPQLVTQYLEFTLTKNVRSNDKATSFNYALLGNPANADTVLEFVKNNISAIRVQYVEDSPANPVQTTLNSLAAYLDEAGLVDYENWLRTTQRGSKQFIGTISAIATAHNNINWGAANAEMILAAARDGAATVAVSAIILVLSVLIPTLL